MGKALLKSQKGVALFAAVMMLILCSGLGLLAFHVSTTEMLISNYGGAELSTAYLAESGVEAVIGWLSDPASSPDRPKFESLAASGCSRNRDETDFSAKDDLLNDVESGPFSELKEMGKIVDLRLYKSSKTGGFCTVESRAENGSGAVKIVVVDLARTPLKPITAGAQGEGRPSEAGPIWVHWGEIRYTGGANLGDPSLIPDLGGVPNGKRYHEMDPKQDPWLNIYVEKKISNGKILSYPSNVHENDASVKLDQWETGDIRSVAAKYGSRYLACGGRILESGGADRDFDEVFIPEQDYGLVIIDRKEGCRSEPIVIGGGKYKGYFFISGDVLIRGDQPGQAVNGHPDGSSSNSSPILLSDINLDGLFYAQGRVEIQGVFSVYGAVVAEKGFTGPGASRLEVWYNRDFEKAFYSGLPSFIRSKGTWRYKPASDM